MMLYLYKFVAGCHDNDAYFLNYERLKIVTTEHRHQVCPPHASTCYVVQSSACNIMSMRSILCALIIQETSCSYCGE